MAGKPAYRRTRTEMKSALKTLAFVSVTAKSTVPSASFPRARSPVWCFVLPPARRACPSQATGEPAGPEWSDGSRSAGGEGVTRHGLPYWRQAVSEGQFLLCFQRNQSCCSNGPDIEGRLTPNSRSPLSMTAKAVNNWGRRKPFKRFCRYHIKKTWHLKKKYISIQVIRIWMFHSLKLYNSANLLALQDVQKAV